jgi:hypothetical protein
MLANTVHYGRRGGSKAHEGDLRFVIVLALAMIDLEVSDWRDGAGL